MASAIDALSGYSSGSDTSTKNTGTSGAVTKDMFLQLLVAQIKNQDPLNPADSVQFVSQLAQFSELEQVIAIRGDIDTLVPASNDKSTGTRNTNQTGSTGSV